MSRQIFEQNIESLNDYNTYVKDQNGYEAAAAAFAEDKQPIETQQQPIIDEQPDVPQMPKEGLFKRFVKDVARGTIGEGGRAIVSGASKGINEIVLPPVEQLAEKRFRADEVSEKSSKGSAFYNKYVTA